MQNLQTFKRMLDYLLQILNRKQKKQGAILFFLLLFVSLLEML